MAAYIFAKFCPALRPRDRRQGFAQLCLHLEEMAAGRETREWLILPPARVVFAHKSDPANFSVNVRVAGMEFARGLERLGRENAQPTPKRTNRAEEEACPDPLSAA